MDRWEFKGSQVNVVSSRTARLCLKKTTKQKPKPKIKQLQFCVFIYLCGCVVQVCEAVCVRERACEEARTECPDHPSRFFSLLPSNWVFHQGGLNNVSPTISSV